MCEACEGFARNTWPRTVLPYALGIAAGAIPAGALFERFPFVLVVAVPVGVLGAMAGVVLWAKPIPVFPVAKACALCKRHDVGYSSPGDTVCADCNETRERERVLAEQRELEADAGYQPSELTMQEKERLLKHARGLTKS